MIERKLPGGMVADKKFTLFHLSLIQRAQLDFETFAGKREAWLRRSLSYRFEFPHWGNEVLTWLPLSPQGGTVIVGVLQRLTKHQRHQSPDDGGTEQVIDEWQGAYVVLDPTHHNDGQKVAIENDVVGQPSSLLKSLVLAINNQVESPFHSSIEPIFDASYFWAFSKRHGDRLRRVTFNFVVPNMWRTENALEQDLKETGEETGAQRLVSGFESDDGVQTTSPTIKTGVGYVERGAGVLTAKSLNGELFSSTRKPRTTSIQSTTGSPAEITNYLFALKDRILGRESSQGVSVTATPLDISGNSSSDIDIN